MHLISAFFTILFAVGLMDSLMVRAQGVPKGRMTPKFRQTILKLHNDYRRSEGATDMKQLRWSPKLERDAEAWANKCRYAHAYGKWGENLFQVESHLPDDVLIERAVNEWYFEKMSWKFMPDCSEACHYTQVVWAKSEEIGCAYKRCPTLFLTEEFIPNGWMLVCYYSPQGNIIGQMPYNHGKPCSACEPGYTCNRGLCNKRIAAQRYLPPERPQHQPRPKPTPRVYRAAPHPPPGAPSQSNRPPPPQSQHASNPVSAEVLQRQPPYHAQSPPQAQPQQPSHQPQYRHQPPPNHPPPRQPVQQQNPPARVHQPPQPQPQHASPQASPYKHQPATNYSPPQYQQPARVWQGQERIPQTNQKQNTAQLSSKVQYISGKVLTGWLPSVTTKAPPNNHSSYPQLSAPADGTPQQQNIPSQQHQPQNPYPVQSSQYIQHGSAQYPAQAQSPQHQPMAQPISQQPPVHHAPQQYRLSQPQQQQVPIQRSAQPSPNQYLQAQPPSHAQSQPQAPQNPYNPPNGQPYQQYQPHYSANASVYPAVAQQQPSVYHQQAYVDPNQHYQQGPVQTGAVFVDPRPIYVPPAPPRQPPPTTTTPAPPINCVDGDANCLHWGVYCKSNPYVHDNCRMTCNTCAVPTPPLVPIKTIRTTAMPTTTPRPSVVPSNPPSPIYPRRDNRNHRYPPRQQPPRRPPPPKYNHLTTTAANYPTTTGYNPNFVPTTQSPYNAGPASPAGAAAAAVGAGPPMGLCRDYDNRCRQWAKYCGIDEYVDDMCRLTCVRCH